VGCNDFVQLVVEKMLTAQGMKRAELGREAFVDKVWEWKEKYGGTITNQMRRLGASCDWSREHFTLDDQLSGANIIVRHLSLFYLCIQFPIPNLPSPPSLRFLRRKKFDEGMHIRICT
jgi:hypothetical protein